LKRIKFININQKNIRNLAQNYIFFYRYKIYHKIFGILQFSSSIIKSNFGSGRQNSSQNPWAKSNFLYPALKLAWVSFETGSMDSISGMGQKTRL
jgi:hypothetical protein